MSLVKLYLRKYNTEETIGTLTDITLETTLAEIRKKIDDAKLFHSDYCFVVFATPLNRKQENKYLAAQCVSKSDQTQTFFCDLQITETTGNDTTSSTTTVLETECETQVSTETISGYDGHDGEQDLESASVSKETESKNLIAGTSGSQIYSDNEIENATRLLEKERMIFANKKAREISRDPFFESWGFQERCGVIEVHWTLMKTKLLESNVQDLESNWANLNDRGPNLKSVLENSEKLNKAQFLADQGYKTFCEEISHHDGERRRDELENQFDVVFTNLKSAQCDVVRSIEQYNKAINQQATMVFNQNIDTASGNKNSKQYDIATGNNLSDSPPMAMQDEQMEFIVASVKDEYEEDILD
jgi:hypothetical protein